MTDDDARDEPTLTRRDSLLGLGGPSFALADHGDHIHVGY